MNRTILSKVQLSVSDQDFPSIYAEKKKFLMRTSQNNAAGNKKAPFNRSSVYTARQKLSYHQMKENERMKEKVLKIRPRTSFHVSSLGSHEMKLSLNTNNHDQYYHSYIPPLVNNNDKNESEDDRDSDLIKSSRSYQEEKSKVPFGDGIHIIKGKEMPEGEVATNLIIKEKIIFERERVDRERIMSNEIKDIQRRQKEMKKLPQLPTKIDKNNKESFRAFLLSKQMQTNNNTKNNTIIDDNVRNCEGESFSYDINTINYDNRIKENFIRKDENISDIGGNISNNNNEDDIINDGMSSNDKKYVNDNVNENGTLPMACLELTKEDIYDGRKKEHKEEEENDFFQIDSIVISGWNEHEEDENDEFLVSSSFSPRRNLLLLSKKQKVIDDLLLPSPNLFNM